MLSLAGENKTNIRRLLNTMNEYLKEECGVEFDPSAIISDQGGAILAGTKAYFEEDLGQSLKGRLQSKFYQIICKIKFNI